MSYAKNEFKRPPKLKLSDFQKNYIIFEKFECEAGNSTSVIVNKCVVGNSGRNGSDRVDVSVHTTIIKPLPELYLHVVVYYKYQEYTKLPIQVWDDACAFLSNKKQSFAMEMIYSVQPFIKYNGQLRCPLKGNLSIDVNNISLNKQFPLIPLLPTGHYLTTVKFFEGDRNTLIGRTKAYTHITDSSVEHSQ